MWGDCGSIVDVVKRQKVSTLRCKRRCASLYWWKAEEPFARRRRRRRSHVHQHARGPANNELKTKTGVRLHLPLFIVFPEPLRNVSHITVTRRFPPDRINCQTLLEPCCFSLPKKWLQLNRCWFWGRRKKALEQASPARFDRMTYFEWNRWNTFSGGVVVMPS